MSDVDSEHPSQEQLQAFGLGRLDEELGARVFGHLGECRDCRILVESLPDDTLTTLVRSSATPQDGTEALDSSFLLNIPETDPLAGHPRYRILGLVGVGGMGVVYRAQHLVMDRVVAVKVIHRQLVEKPATAERFRREVKAAAGLAHPNIVTAFDADQAGDRHFLVMEYVPGITLAQLLTEQGPLPPARACDYIRQAALGLQHAHERRLVHRDIKPHNLMLTPEGQIKILDFGLARLGQEPADALTQSGTVMGSADFLAPEQADDPHLADTRADIYSLGCTLFFLLTGKPPFAEGSLVQKLKAHALRKPPSLAGARARLPEGLDRVVERMLAKEPAQRFQTPAEVAHALAPFAADLPTIDVKARTSGQKRLGRMLAAVTLIGAALVLLSAAVYRIATDHADLEITTNDPDIQVILEQNGDQVRVVDLRTQQTLTLRSGEYSVKADGKGGSVEVDPGRIVMKRGDKVTVTVKRGLVLLKRFQGPHHVGVAALSPDGKLALTGHDDGSIVSWDIAKGVETARFEGHGRNIQDLTFTKDSKRFLSCSRDGTVRLWDVATGKEIRQYTGHDGEVWAARLSPDDRFVLTGCHDKKLRLFDLETGAEKKVLTGHEEAVICVAFAPDGHRALSTAWDNTIRLWDLDKGNEIQSWTMDRSSRRVAWSSDGQCFLSSSTADPGKVLLWDLNKKKPILSCEGHVKDVYAIAFAADGRFAVSSGHDGSVRFWDLKTGREILRHEGLFENYTLQISRDGRLLLTSAGARTSAANLYRLPQGLWPDGKQRLEEKKR